MSRGVVPELHVELVNTASEPWINRAEDRGHVAGWVSDLAGECVVESSPWVVTTGAATTVPDLDPGQRLDLAVRLDPSGLDRLPSGRYQLEAVLLSLDLHSGLTALDIT